MRSIAVGSTVIAYRSDRGVVTAIDRVGADVTIRVEYEDGMFDEFDPSDFDEPDRVRLAAAADPLCQRCSDDGWCCGPCDCATGLRAMEATSPARRYEEAAARGDYMRDLAKDEGR